VPNGLHPGSKLGMTKRVLLHAGLVVHPSTLTSIYQKKKGAVFSRRWVLTTGLNMDDSGDPGERSETTRHQQAMRHEKDKLESMRADLQLLFAEGITSLAAHKITAPVHTCRRATTETVLRCGMISAPSEFGRLLQRLVDGGQVRSIWPG
jgi:hypothetical protein